VPDYIVLKIDGYGDGVDHGIAVFPGGGLKQLANDLQTAALVILRHVNEHGDGADAMAPNVTATAPGGQTTWTEAEMPHPNAGVEPPKKEELE
jgi:hypothetical protein